MPTNTRRFQFVVIPPQIIEVRAFCRCTAKQAGGSGFFVPFGLQAATLHSPLPPFSLSPRPYGGRSAPNQQAAAAAALRGSRRACANFPIVTFSAIITRGVAVFCCQPSLSRFLAIMAASRLAMRCASARYGNQAAVAGSLGSSPAPRPAACAPCRAAGSAENAPRRSGFPSPPP